MKVLNRADAGHDQLQRFEQDVTSCIECGTCTIWCPVYQAKPVETSVARGKNKLIRAVLAGEDADPKELREALDTCTLCLACTAHCPVRSQVPLTIVAARADQVASSGVPFPSNLLYRTLGRRTMLARTVRAASWFQRHLTFSSSLNGKHIRIPAVARTALRQTIGKVHTPAAGVKTKARVGYFIGCMTDVVFPEVGRKVIGFLTRQGVEVVMPEEQACCGAPVFLGGGDLETGRRMADANVKLFEEVDYVVSDCATCSSALKDYVTFLADTPARKEAYGTLGEKVRDVSQFLFDNLKLPLSAYRPVQDIKGKRITWHDPCHLARHLGVREQPRKIMRALTGVDYAEMPRADFCCGMGGGFGISYYDLSKKIADKAAETIRAVGADVVVTACPGCMVQLMDACRRNNMPVKVKHIMEVLE